MTLKTAISCRIYHIVSFSLVIYRFCRYKHIILSFFTAVISLSGCFSKFKAQTNHPLFAWSLLLVSEI